MYSSSKHHYVPIEGVDQRIQVNERFHNRIFVFFYCVLLFLCTSLSFLAGQRWRSEKHFGIALEWADDLANLPTRPTKYNGSFILESEFRGPPTPELDQAWDRFTSNPYLDGTASIFPVELRDIQRSNKTSSNDWVNATVEYGEVNGGGFTGTLEMFHQLHCLNMLRKFVHIDYYQDADSMFNGSRPEVLMHHLDHCVEIIRQVISCNGDTGLIVMKWVKGNPVPYPDFNTWHQCRNPEEILQWAKAREKPITQWINKDLASNLVEMPEAP